MAWFSALHRQYGYANVRLADPDGKVLLALGESDDLAPTLREAVQTAFSERRALLTDIHTMSDGGRPHLDSIAPLFSSAESGGQPLAAVILTADAGDFLFPLIQSWPTASTSGETLLVERRGDSVVFLNELRFRQGTALTLEYPLTQTDLPAVMAVLGTRGIAQGIDYRGVEVLTALQAVPDSPWFIVAKIDAAEAFAGAHTRVTLIVVVVALLLAAMGGTTAVIWQRVLKKRYREAYDAEASRAMMSARYEHIVQQANDIILLSDESARLVEVNERAVETYGYTRDEMLGMQVAEIIPAEGLPAFAERMRSLQQTGSYILEAFHQRKDGSAFPVEISARMVTTEGKHFLQAIVRDLTERRRTDAVRQLMQYSIDNAADSVFWTDAAGRLLFVSESTCRRHGYSRDELLAMTIFDLDPTLPREQWTANWQKLKRGETLHVETVHHTKGGEVFPVEVRGNYVESDGAGVQLRIRPGHHRTHGGGGGPERARRTATAVPKDGSRRPACRWHSS